MASLLESARTLYSLGFSLIPLRRKGKTPVIAKWKPYQETRASLAQIEDWFKNDRHNIGIATGKLSGVIVADSDSPAAEQWAIANLPPTAWIVVTSRGKHRFYRHPGEPIHNSTLLHSVIDVRGDGGYVVAPWSIHPDGGIYTPLNWPWNIGDDVPIAPAEKLKVEGDGFHERSYVNKVLESECHNVATAKEGERNNVLNRAAFAFGQFIAGGMLGRQEAESLLHGAAAIAGLGAKEADATISSGIEAGIKKPRRGIDLNGKRKREPDAAAYMTSAIEPQESPAHRRPAIDVLMDLCRDLFTWREGSQCYWSEAGRMVNAKEWSECYMPAYLRMLMEWSIEMLGVVTRCKSSHKREEASIRLWKKWCRPAYQAVLNDIPLRFGITKEEEHSLPGMVRWLVSKEIRVSFGHDEIPIHTSILQQMYESQAKSWQPVGHFPAFVRERGIALKFELFTQSKMLHPLTRNALTNSFRTSMIAEPKVIRVGNKAIRAYVLRQDWLEKEFGHAINAAQQQANGAQSQIPLDDLLENDNDECNIDVTYQDGLK